MKFLNTDKLPCNPQNTEHHVMNIKQIKWP